MGLTPHSSSLTPKLAERTNMNIILMGPPGSGKGTQAANLAASLDIYAVSSGDLFRDHQRRDTELGQLARSYMERGVYVPDDVTIGMITEWINDPDHASGFVLDGFPRTQAPGPGPRRRPHRTRRNRPRSLHPRLRRRASATTRRQDDLHGVPATVQPQLVPSRHVRQVRRRRRRPLPARRRQGRSSHKANRSVQPGDRAGRGLLPPSRQHNRSRWRTVSRASSCPPYPPQSNRKVPTPSFPRKREPTLSMRVKTKH